MKKFLSLFFAFLLVFAFSFTVYAEGEEEETEETETALITVTPVLSVEGNNDSVVLTWTGDENATSYIIYRSNNAKKGFKEIKTVTTTTYTDKKLTYNKTYYYKVKAVGASNSLTGAVVSKKVAVNKVTNVSATPATKSVKLTWDKSAPSGYYVLRSTDKKKYTKIATITKASTTSYTDKKVKAKTTYYYQVQAYYKKGSTVKTGAKSDTLKVKTLYTIPVVKASNYSIYALEFKIKKDSNADHYEVFQAETKNGEYTKAYDLTNDYLSDGYVWGSIHVDEPGQTVYLKIRACQTETYCSSFVALSATPKVSVPYFTSLKGSTKSVELRFGAYDSGSNAVFEIYKSTSKSGKYTKVGSFNGESYPYYFKDTKVSSGKAYYYKLRLKITIDDKTYTSSFSKPLIVRTGKGAEVLSATEDAKRMNKDWPMSKSEMIEILTESYGYTLDQAKKGVAKAKIDFKTNAYKYAKEYVDYGYVITEDNVRSMLQSSGFTNKEIEYALNKLKINWKNRLKKVMKADLDWGTSRASLLSYYASEYTGLTETQVNTVIDEMNIDFNEQALIALNRNLYYKQDDATFVSATFTRVGARYILTNEETGFTETEIAYAIANLDHDWVNEIVKDFNNHSYQTQSLSKAVIVEMYNNEAVGFTIEEIEAAIERLDIDFVNNAIYHVEEKIETENISASALITYLTEELGFTTDEAEEAVYYGEYDFGVECADYVNEVYVNVSGDPTYTMTQVINDLLSKGFTDDDIDYAIDNTDINNHVIEEN